MTGGGKIKPKNQRDEGAIERPSKSTNSSEADPPTHDQIQLRAYYIHLERGGEHGYDIEDWLAAERELAEGPRPNPPDNK
jgi:hypothetical protein